MDRAAGSAVGSPVERLSTSRTPFTSVQQKSRGLASAASLCPGERGPPRIAQALYKCRGLKKEGGNLLRGVPPTKKLSPVVHQPSPVSSNRFTSRRAV